MLIGSTTEAYETAPKGPSPPVDLTNKEGSLHWPVALAHRSGMSPVAVQRGRRLSSHDDNANIPDDVIIANNILHFEIIIAK